MSGEIDALLGNAIFAQYEAQHAKPPSGAVCAQDIMERFGCTKPSAENWLEHQGYESGLFVVRERRRRYYWPRTAAPA